MQTDIVTIDFRRSKSARRAVRWGLMPLAVLLGSMAAAKAYDTTWIASGQPVSSAKLKADLDEAQSRLAALEGAIGAMPKMTAWAPYNPKVKTAGGLDVTGSMTTTAYWRRVADSAEIMVTSVVVACQTVDELYWSLPAGLTADGTKLPDTYAVLGEGEAAGSGTGGAPVPMILNAQPGVWATFVAGDVAGTSGGTTCATVEVNGVFRFHVTVPIATWTTTGP